MRRGWRWARRAWSSCLWRLALSPPLSLQDEAKADFNQAIGWCVSLITDYRVRLGAWDLRGLGHGAGGD